MNISSKFSHWFIALVAVIVVSIAATLIQWRITENEILKAEQKEQSQQIVYGADGKLDGEALSLMPIKITDEYIIYEDRVLDRFFGYEEDTAETVEALNAAFTWVPEGINKYLIAVPSRIAFEEMTTVNDPAILRQTFDTVIADVEANVEIIDAYTALQNHKDEYIYFRTNNSWTALGAYYAAEKFLQSKGIDIYPLDEYYEDKFTSYSGAFRYVEGAEFTDNYHDIVFFYYLRDSVNSQNITAYIDSGVYEEFQCPVLALSRRSADIFVGSYYSHSIIEGDLEDGSSIMVLGDKYSKIFVPWLIPYYDKICLVDPAYYNGDTNALEKIINTYNVEDLLIIESADMIQTGIRNKRMISIFEQETP